MLRSMIFRGNIFFQNKSGTQLFPIHLFSVVRITLQNCGCLLYEKNSSYFTPQKDILTDTVILLSVSMNRLVHRLSDRIL